MWQRYIKHPPLAPVVGTNIVVRGTDANIGVRTAEGSPISILPARSRVASIVELSKGNYTVHAIAPGIATFCVQFHSKRCFANFVSPEARSSAAPANSRE